MKSICGLFWTGASIPMGQEGTCPSPNIYEGGTSMVMSPNILEVILSSNSNNCCLLYFNANIMCSFTIKASASGGRDPLPGLRPWTPLRDFIPQKLKLFFVKLHILFALKYNKQQLLLLLDKINPAAKYENSKILGGHYYGRPPFINIGGHVPPVP